MWNPGKRICCCILPARTMSDSESRGSTLRVNDLECKDGQLRLCGILKENGEKEKVIYEELPKKNKIPRYKVSLLLMDNIEQEMGNIGNGEE